MQDGKCPDCGQDLVKQAVGELAAMEYAGDVRAIGCVVVDKDGDLRVITAFGEGTRLAIMAGSVILQRHLMEQVQQIDKPRTI